MFELGEISGFTHTRPNFNIKHIRGPNGGVIDIRETVISGTAFCDLVKSSRLDDDERIRILLVAPMSGHFATLLRATITTLLQDFDVYVTDWRNARDVPLSEGVMTLDRYTEHIIDFIRQIGPRTHVVAVCQPVVGALAATAVMAKEGDPLQPASLTLMAGPIDTRISPTAVNDLTMSKPIEWFEKNLISTVPAGLPGAGRRVYPGFVQLAAFMSMNSERHAKSFAEMYRCRVEGETTKAEQIRLFYEEYFAVMDLDASFYLETIETIFQKYALPTGTLTYKGAVVEPAAIRKTFLLTIEGERDDICAMGQTMAAHDLCTGLRPYMKSHHLQPGVGHYGVFNGKRWDKQIYPVVRDHIQSSH
jgi:polyhydroxyalkanoate depolymerase